MSAFGAVALFGMPGGDLRMAAGVFCSAVLIAAMGRVLDMPLLMAPFLATAALKHSAPHLPGVAPRRVIGGHVVGAVAGVMVGNLLGVGVIAEHAQEQKKRIEENKRRARDAWAWTSPLLADLTPRDLYRFRATSTLIRAAEKAGARIETALLIGDLTFKVQQDAIVVRLVEKMHKPLMMPKGEAGAWTAYPNHHQSGLMGTGFLRAAITTYIPNTKPEWLETKARRIDVIIPEIAAAIVEAGPRLVAWRAELEQQRLESQRREQERYERQRKREQEERRWQFFRASAVDWQERQRLDEFITELKHRLTAEGDAIIDGQLLSIWLAWARERSAGLDPFSDGVSGFFDRLVKR